MGKKHQSTFAAITKKPDCKDIDWNDFISLLNYLGATIKNQSGSSVGVRLNSVYAVFHRPHPERHIYVSDLKRIRRFLMEAGINEVEK